MMEPLVDRKSLQVLIHLNSLAYMDLYHDPIKAEKVCTEFFDAADYNQNGKIDFTGYFYVLN